MEHGADRVGRGSVGRFGGTISVAFRWAQESAGGGARQFPGAIGKAIRNGAPNSGFPQGRA
jgi:hypothetical protein